MVNQPTYNPNDRDQINAKMYRNRAVTDIVEPGSSMKPFFVAAGLASGRFTDQSIIDTKSWLHKGRIQTTRGSAQPRRDQSRDLPLQEFEHLPDQGGARARTLADVRHTDRAGLWPGHDERLPGRVGRPAASLLALAPGGHFVDVARLRTVDHARCSSHMRMPRSRRSDCRGPSPSCASRRRRKAPAYSTTRWRTHWCICSRRSSRPDGGGKQAAIPGYTVAGKTGTAWKANRGRIRDRPISRGIRRRRAGQQPAACGRGVDRRAGCGQILRRRSRGAGVSRGWSAARCVSWRCRPMRR